MLLKKAHLSRAARDFARLTLQDSGPFLATVGSKKEEIQGNEIHFKILGEKLE